MFISICNDDHNLAKAALFIMEHKHTIHPAYTTTDMVALIYGYVTNGHIITVKDGNGDIIGITAFFIGTEDEQFRNKQIAYVDVAVCTKEYKLSRIFMRGLSYLIRTLATEYPTVEQVQFAALIENEYLCKLYGKLTTSHFDRPGTIGDERVFSAPISHFQSFLTKFSLL